MPRQIIEIPMNKTGGKKPYRELPKSQPVNWGYTVPASSTYVSQPAPVPQKTYADYAPPQRFIDNRGSHVNYAGGDPYSYDARKYNGQVIGNMRNQREWDAVKNLGMLGLSIVSDPLALAMSGIDFANNPNMSNAASFAVDAITPGNFGSFAKGMTAAIPMFGLNNYDDVYRFHYKTTYDNYHVPKVNPLRSYMQRSVQSHPEVVKMVNDYTQGALNRLGNTSIFRGKDNRYSYPMLLYNAKYGKVPIIDIDLPTGPHPIDAITYPNERSVLEALRKATELNPSSVYDIYGSSGGLHIANVGQNNQLSNRFLRDIEEQFPNIKIDPYWASHLSGFFPDMPIRVSNKYSNYKDMKTGKTFQGMDNRNYANAYLGRIGEGPVNQESINMLESSFEPMSDLTFATNLFPKTGKGFMAPMQKYVNQLNRIKYINNMFTNPAIRF